MRFGTSAEPGGSAVFLTTVDTGALFDGPPVTVDCGDRRLTDAGDDLSTHPSDTVMFSLEGFGAAQGSTTGVHVAQVGGEVTCIDVHGRWTGIEGEAAGHQGEWHLTTRADGSVSVTFSDGSASA